jgi:hypothetical protein
MTIQNVILAATFVLVLRPGPVESISAGHAVHPALTPAGRRAANRREPGVRSQSCSARSVIPLSRLGGRLPRAPRLRVGKELRGD